MIGLLLCWLGFHDPVMLRWLSGKYEQVCDRCGTSL